ncbi:MAG TPA: efflux RND transporter periplasmic adaptor subunit [Gemmatimonadaceae bacterium]|jgi:HlyD family secretion protein|nr:efflux RND transporter periplasmic adaptor subunit [Gemmatimonadaceae bacterium]
MSKRTKWSIGTILVALVVGVIVLGAAKRGNKAVEVREEKVQKRDLVASVTASGQVEPRVKVDVASDVSGRIVRLAVKEGDVVKKGQFLLQIDPSTYEAEVQRSRAAVASARADMARAKANLEQSQSALQRSETIRKSNPRLVSDEQMEQLRTTVDVNQALFNSASHMVDQSVAALSNSQSNLAKTTIKAPLSGKVTRLNVEQGETAVPGTFNKDAALLLTISNMDTLETTVKVDETDVARVALGDSAVVQIDAFPDTTFVGRVVEIANSSVQNPTAASSQNTDQAVDFEVKVMLLNPPSDTRPDFSATAKIITATRKQVLSIPIIALTVRDRQANPSGDSAQLALGKRPSKQVGQEEVEGVFLVGPDNKVTFQPVKIGIAGEDYFEVVSGLQGGETIVAGSYQAIRDLKEGTLVRETKPAETKKGVGT